jgi:hypothetical protein
MSIAIESLQKVTFVQIGVQLVSYSYHLIYPIINTEFYTQKSLCAC